MIKKIITGGQTGADRAALDVAIQFNIPHGGWIPEGRKAEDGPLSDRYQLQEMPTASYPARTEKNVQDSDGTLIIARGKLTGGTDLTRQMTLKHKKQLLGIDLNLMGHFDAASLAASWIRLQHVQVLNVAGPRASEDPQIYSDVVIILEQVVKILTDEDKNPKVELAHSDSGKPSEPPKTVQEAVDTKLDSYTYDDSGTDTFHREPFIAYFKATDSPFDVVIINIHVDPDDAEAEINALPAVIADATTRLSESDVILLGDLNADCKYFDEDDQTSPLRAQGFKWLITNDMDTNLAKSSCTYDRIISTLTLDQDYTGNAEVFRFDQEFELDCEPKEVSDHYPVVAEFFVDNDTD